LMEEGTDDRRRSPSERLVQARLLLVEADSEGALGILSTVLDGSACSRDPATRAQAWLLRSRASHVLGRTDDAANALGRAIDLCEPEENRRALLDAGTSGRSLLMHYRSRIDSSWPFLDELVHAGLDRVTAGASSLPPVIERLSQRERDVLGYLPSMLTFVEIGSELYISVNTTKSHVRSIYRKLGVAGRRDAVSRARQLHLLRS
jgi:LuxR family maltose regulon positive regulatory protein